MSDEPPHPRQRPRPKGVDRGFPGPGEGADPVWLLLGDLPRGQGPYLTQVLGLAAYAWQLRAHGHPDELRRAAELVESHGWGRAGRAISERLRVSASMAANALAQLERHGIEYDRETRMFRLPAAGGRGPGPRLMTALVGAAWEELGGRRLPAWYAGDVLGAIRTRLASFLDAEELTDTRLKRRLQAYIEGAMAL